MYSEMKKGKLIVFSAPSGSGKTTLVNHLLKQDLPLGFSISATSRAPRLRHLTTQQTTQGLPVTSEVFRSSGWVHPDYR